MKNKILAVVGMCGSGKSVATEVFVKAGWHKVYFGAITFEEMARRNMAVNEANERKIREEFRASGDKAIYAKLNKEKIDTLLAKGNVLVESMYSWSEYKYLKEQYGDTLLEKPLTFFREIGIEHELNKIRKDTP